MTSFPTNHGIILAKRCKNVNEMHVHVRPTDKGNTVNICMMLCISYFILGVRAEFHVGMQIFRIFWYGLGHCAFTLRNYVCACIVPVLMYMYMYMYVYIHNTHFRVCRLVQFLRADDRLATPSSLTWFQLRL